MKFEDTIKKISGFVAGLLIFFIGAGMYLNLKGFIMSPDGRPVLVKEARAAANPKDADGLAEKIAANVNVILPKGHPGRQQRRADFNLRIFLFRLLPLLRFSSRNPAQTSKRLY